MKMNNFRSDFGGDWVRKEHFDEVIEAFNKALANATNLLITQGDEDAHSDWIDQTDFSVIWDYLPRVEQESIDAVQRINAGEE